MKLEVGMYVRTPKGIAKIEEITEDRTEIYFNCDTGLTISFIKKNFTQEEMAEFYKHSHNIIDLIEVGDYVNGNKIIKTSTDYCGRNILIYGYDFGDRQVAITIYEDEIKSIVTKEQFESIKYSLEG